MFLLGALSCLVGGRDKDKPAPEIRTGTQMAGAHSKCRSVGRESVRFKQKGRGGYAGIDVTKRTGEREAWKQRSSKGRGKQRTGDQGIAAAAVRTRGATQLPF